MNDQISIRTLTEADLPAIRTLAQLDSQPNPALPLLGAERDGKLLAAVSLDAATVIANPWELTAELVDLLKLRLQQRATSYACSSGAMVRPAALSSSQ